MTISSTTNRKEYTGNGATTSFSFPYYVLAAADLKVYQNGVLKTLTTHYTLSGSAPYASGTNVQFVTAPASNDQVVILRDPTATQSLDLVENDPLPAEELEKAYDRLTMLIQRLVERVDRVFRLADTDVSGASVTVPTPQPNQVLGWNSDGTALVNTTALTGGYVVSPFAATVLDDTDAATARATLGALASSAVSAFILTLLDDADAAAALATLGITLPLPIASGGTGATNAAAAFAALKQQADTTTTGVSRFATIPETLNWSASPINTAACTPASLAGTRAFSTSGYQRFPGGLLLQWGQSASMAPDANSTLTLPMAFPTGVINAFCTLQNSDTGNDDVFARLISISTTQITVRAEGTSGAVAGTRYINYLAIGY